MEDPVTLKVSEIFYSLQGEGARAGEPSLFVRLQGCSAQHACYAAGIRCDTEFESGAAMAMEELLDRLYKLGEGCPWIVWTGGEPLDQLRPVHLDMARQRGYLNALETSGVRPLGMQMVDRLDWITVSPKAAENVLRRNFTTGYVLERDVNMLTGKELRADAHELRYVRHSGHLGIPMPSLKALFYFLSPHSDGDQLNAENFRHCHDLALQHPRWRVSLQMHKAWRVL